MKYPLIANKLLNEPWLITPETHMVMQEILNSRLAGEVVSFSEDDEREERKPYQVIDQTAMISISGVIGKRLGMFERACGGVCLDHLQTIIDTAVFDSSIKNILIYINSPGGTVTGVYEFGLALEKYSQIKPIYSFTDTKCCSAAYWIAAKTENIFVTPSANIGSIGVYLAWFDYAEARKKAGVKLQLFEAGKNKAVGLRSPSQEELEIYQKRVDKIHMQFKEEVTKKRKIDSQFMEGGTYDGAEAIENNLADSLVMTISEVLELIAS